jgi:hypothetical protein
MTAVERLAQVVAGIDWCVVHMCLVGFGNAVGLAAICGKSLLICLLPHGLWRLTDIIRLVDN